MKKALALAECQYDLVPARPRVLESLPSLELEFSAIRRESLIFGHDFPPQQGAAGDAIAPLFRGTPAKACRMSSAIPASQSPHPKLWENKNPWIAGLLAYLIPGAGHIYQGRTVKGMIYCLSILGLFFWGQKMGEGMVVYNRPEPGGALRHVALSYVAQLGAGAAALPVLLQNRRAGDPSNRVVTKGRFSGPMTAPFEGVLNPIENTEAGYLAGSIRLESAEGPFGPEVRGIFDGTLDGQPTKLVLGGAGRFELDRPIKAGYRRSLEIGVVDEDMAAHPVPRWIDGSIPRPFMNAYGSPPDQDQLQEINGRLGKVYELALVFTWIAGLLNVLAIWDCVLGPAYGFGDEYALAKAAEARSAPPPMPPTSPPASTPPVGGKEDPPRAENRPVQKSPV